MFAKGSSKSIFFKQYMEEEHFEPNRERIIAKIEDEDVRGEVRGLVNTLLRNIKISKQTIVHHREEIFDLKYPHNEWDWGNDA